MILKIILLILISLFLIAAVVIVTAELFALFWSIVDDVNKEDIK